MRHLALPSQLHKEDKCHTRERVAIHATTGLTPNQTLRILERLVRRPESVGDVPNTASCPASLAPNCTVVVDELIDGDRADAVAYWHEIVVRHGAPPKGAVRFRRVHTAPTCGLGSNIVVDLFTYK